MKCDMCNKSFTIEHKGSGGHNRKYCYTCYPHGLTRTERRIRRSELLQAKSDNYKLEKGCSVCGYNKCSAALEWHHTEDNKLEHPSNALKRGWEAYILESDKCDLVCANCHREIHNKQ